MSVDFLPIFNTVDKKIVIKRFSLKLEQVINQ